SDVRLVPMWQYQSFRPWYYLWQSSWNQDALLPLLGLLGAALLAARGRYRRPVRFLLLTHLTACLFMGFTLPNSQFRYVFHLLPLPILLAALVVVTVARSLIALARRPAAARGYAAFVGAALAAGFVVLGSGATGELRELTRLR